MAWNRTALSRLSRLISSLTVALLPRLCTLAGLATNLKNPLPGVEVVHRLRQDRKITFILNGQDQAVEISDLPAAKDLTLGTCFPGGSLKLAAYDVRVFETSHSA